MASLASFGSAAAAVSRGAQYAPDLCADPFTPQPILSQRILSSRLNKTVLHTVQLLLLEALGILTGKTMSEM